MAVCHVNYNVVVEQVHNYVEPWSNCKHIAIGGRLCLCVLNPKERRVRIISWSCEQLACINLRTNSIANL